MKRGLNIEELSSGGVKATLTEDGVPVLELVLHGNYAAVSQVARVVNLTDLWFLEKTPAAGIRSLYANAQFVTVSVPQAPTPSPSP